MTSSYAFGEDPAERIQRGIAAAFRAMAGPGRSRHRHGGPHRRPGDFMFGPGFPFGGPPFRHGRKARRGDVRAAALVLLESEPRNGYQLMQEIERRSDGAWRPSPGAVYPALQQLEDEGLVRTRETDGRKLFELTDAGRAHVEEHRAELGQPWEAFSGEVSDETWELARLMKDLGAAAFQVLRAGDEGQVERARKVLADARKALYLILADDEQGQVE
jgi:DNA-binding PadR family transcriptional regulator